MLWTRDTLLAECKRQATIHEAQGKSDEAHDHRTGAVFHDKRAAFYRALMALLTDEQPA